MPMDKPTADSRSVQSFAIIKTLDTRIFSLALFKLELEMDYPSETNLCKVTPAAPTDTPSSIFSEGRGAAVHRLSETDNLNG